jgi:MurNAc alpha-1-phosphate uridylyltransferase
MIPITAMVLAAGLGTRMRPLTHDRPKALVQVGGRALIDHVIDRLAAAGVRRVIVNVHAFADQLEAHVRRRRDVQVIISDERELLLETGGGLKKARQFLGDAPVVVANIDSVWEEPRGSAIARLAQSFKPGMGALLMLAGMDEQLGYDGVGDFSLAPDGRIAFRGDRPSAPWAYMGVQIVEPSIVDPEPEEPFSLTRVWRRLADEGRLYGAPLGGFWMHVGDPQAREEAEARMTRRAESA